MVRGREQRQLADGLNMGEGGGKVRAWRKTCGRRWGAVARPHSRGSSADDEGVGKAANRSSQKGEESAQERIRKVK